MENHHKNQNTVEDKIMLSNVLDQQELTEINENQHELYHSSNSQDSGSQTESQLQINNTLAQDNFPMVSNTLPIRIPHIFLARRAYINGLPIEPQTRDPEHFYCLKCKKKQKSKIEFKMGEGSWIWVFMCCTFFSPIGLCPFCSKDCQDAVHFCPQCKSEVGRNRFCFS